MARAIHALGTIRELSVSEQFLHRDHLLRLDADSRRDRFNGVVDDAFIDAYSKRSFSGRARVFAFIDRRGIVRGTAELHSPVNGEPAEIAFSVEHDFQHAGIGTQLFEAILAAARYSRFKELRITSSASNHAMRALAGRFGATFTFMQGEVVGTLKVPRGKADIPVRRPPPVCAWQGIPAE